MKKRETIGKRMFVTLAAAFVMILMMGVPTLAAGSLDVELVPNGKGAYVYTGRMPDYNTVVYHKLTVNKSGALVVAGASFSDYGNQWGLSVVLCNSKKQPIEYSSSYVSGDDVATYGVKPGIYYLQVKNQKNYVVSAALQNMADKGGASKKKATTIKHKKTITGVMPAGEKAKKADWFKFKMTKSKKLQLNISVEANGYIEFYVYGPSYPKGTRLGSIKSGANQYYSVSGYFSKKKAKIKPGTYYIKAVRSGYSSNKKASGVYTIKWMMK
ncbi:MAG: hypothetical protein PUD04_04035 [Firmicutes bacterium]|nr:hypothetical protein [Bacillota bacterium]